MSRRYSKRYHARTLRNENKELMAVVIYRDPPLTKILDVETTISLKVGDFVFLQNEPISQIDFDMWRAFDLVPIYKLNSFMKPDENEEIILW